MFDVRRNARCCGRRTTPKLREQADGSSDASLNRSEERGCADQPQHVLISQRFEIFGTHGLPLWPVKRQDQAVGDPNKIQPAIVNFKRNLIVTFEKGTQEV